MISLSRIQKQYGKQVLFVYDRLEGTDGKPYYFPDDLTDKADRGRLMYSVRRDRMGEAFTAGELKDARERAQRMISLCPSGRLVEITPSGEDREPAFEPSIAVERDGPLLVRGGIPVESEDGTPWEVRNRVALCRCGHSTNKPFCDGSHKVVGFRDG